MTSAAAVLACALTVLGRSANQLPPIELVASAPLTGSRYVEAYVQPPLKVIFLVTTSEVFQDALRAQRKCGNLDALRKIASVIAHEHWHVVNGSDEQGAYEAQLSTLIRVGSSPDSRLYHSVVRSMQAVMRQQNKKPELVIVSITPNTAPQ